MFRTIVTLVCAAGILAPGLASGAGPIHEPTQIANDMFPRWFPDGTRMVFTSDRDGDPEIYVMSADGSSPVRLTYTPGRDAHPCFSRDARRIIFQSPRANRTDTNIYRMNADGTNVVQLTNLKGFAGVPVYSPDEHLVAFQWRETNNSDDGRKWRICIMNGDGSGVHVITPGNANDQVPGWSRDGKRLLFYSDRTGRDQTYTMRPDGTGVRPLATTAFADSSASWSPDNERIAFASSRDGQSDIYVMDAEGGHVRRLTNSSDVKRGPVWSPDGKKIVFTAEAGGSSTIYLMDSDGSRLVRVTPMFAR